MEVTVDHSGHKQAAGAIDGFFPVAFARGDDTDNPTILDHDVERIRADQCIPPPGNTTVRDYGRSYVGLLFQHPSTLYCAKCKLQLLHTIYID